MTQNTAEAVCLLSVPPTGTTNRGADEYLAGGPVSRALHPAEEADGGGGGGGGPGGPPPLQRRPLDPPAGGC